MIRRNQYSGMSLTERFEEKYTIDTDTGCWLWAASTDPKGYGRIAVNGKMRFAHRISWELHNKPIPGGVCCLHHCDVPACVCPTHLFLGSQADNIKDMDNKGRRNLGEQHPNSKLTEGSVKMIRKYYASGGCTQKWLADIYGVSFQLISLVVNRKIWGHV